MIKYSLDGNISIKWPSAVASLSDDEFEIARHGCLAFWYLLNTAEHRGNWVPLSDFASMIRQHSTSQKAIATADAIESI